MNGASAATPNARPHVPRRLFVTLVAYLETGSHAAAAHRLGISTSTSRQRISELIRLKGVHNVAQVAWAMRAELEKEREDRVTAASAQGPVPRSGQHDRRHANR